MEKLTKQKGEALGFHRNTVADLIRRGAVVIDEVVYAPVKKRKPKGRRLDALLMQL